VDGPTYRLTSKNGRYHINELLDDGWEPLRETPPSFSMQDVHINGSTEEQNVGVSLVVLRRPRCNELSGIYSIFINKTTLCALLISGASSNTPKLWWTWKKRNGAIQW